MGTVKLGIKLVGTHAIISILEFFLLVPLTGLWENNQLYQWIIGLLQIFIFGFIIYADISNASQNELKRTLFGNQRFFRKFVSNHTCSYPLFIDYAIKTQPTMQKSFLDLASALFQDISNLRKHMPYLAIYPIILFHHYRSELPGWD